MQNNTFNLVVCGPNLRDQSKGSFHVHAAGCADLKRGASREPEYRNGWALTVGTRLDVAGEVYADMIDESGDDAASYLHDFHFFPCCADVPAGDALPLIEAEGEAPAQTAVAVDRHVLLATDADGSVHALVEFDSYNDAVAAWQKHDDRRIRGRRPHVRHYEVRSTDDPKAQRANRRNVRRFGCDVVGSCGYGDGDQYTGAEKAARAAIHRRIPLRDRWGTTKQGVGGWYWEADGTTTLTQGMNDLARIAQARGWIVKAQNGRFFAVVNESVEA